MPDTEPPPSPRSPAEQRQRYAELFNQAPSMRHFGFQVSFPSEKRVRVEVAVGPEHRGGLGTAAVNGGVISALFDLVIGCTPALVDPTRRSATVQLSIRFEQPTVGDRVFAEAWIDHATGSNLFCSAELYDGAGKVTARCQGQVRLSKLSWGGGESPGSY